MNRASTILFAVALSVIATAAEAHEVIGRSEVGAGTGPFNERETAAIRDYVQAVNPEAVVFLHSASNNIWYGGLRDGWAPTRRLPEAYSRGSGY